MDRTDDFRRLLSIYPTYKPSNDVFNAVSKFTSLAVSVASGLRQSRDLVQRVVRLSLQRGFSNDPTVQLDTSSSHFKTNISLIQKELKQLEKSLSSAQRGVGPDGKELLVSQQEQHHRRFIIQILQSESKSQIEAVQTAIKSHSEHAKLRSKRVERYGSNIDVMSLAKDSAIANSAGTNRNSVSNLGRGGGPPNSFVATGGNANGTGVGSGVGVSTSSARSSKSSSASAPKYAMFAETPTGVSALRRRGAGAEIGGDGSDGAAGGRAHGGALSTKLITPRATQTTRLQTAERVEASIAQLGELFGQMATLVMDQGETLARIEDDVEAGLDNTVEGHKELQNFLAITRGNRGIILKIFGLLVFFILLFMYIT